MALRLGATRCLRKPFRPTTLLSVIDECLREAEPHRRYVTTLAAVASAVSEAHDKTMLSTGSWEEVLAV
jgi:DNA-binding response OmpR family regulator